MKVFLLIIALTLSVAAPNFDFAKLQNDATDIINYVTAGAFAGETFDRLQEFTDTIGDRLSGSQAYNNAVNYMKAKMLADGLDNVHGEPAYVPRWERHEESATMVYPRNVTLRMLGLGLSIGTQSYGPDGITAQAVVVNNYDELDSLGAKGVLQGKIVVYNQYCNWDADPIGCYYAGTPYRNNGAARASQYGAVAALIRSLSSFSIASPHTGRMSYDPKYPQIPGASICTEDADMLGRLYNRSETIIINLKMNCLNFNDTLQENVIAEIKGSVWPEQTVLISGHLDSWDGGFGVMDDGGGVAISWNALTVLKRLGIKPKRTIRAVLWASEEFGGIGANQYFKDHQAEVPTMSIVLESDLGTFTPYGIQFTGSQSAMDIMTQIGQSLTSINASVVTSGGGGTDIAPWMNAGVPGGSLDNANGRYFWFHHAQGDRMSIETSKDLDLCLATWAVTALGVANLDDLLPRDPANALLTHQGDRKYIQE